MPFTRRHATRPQVAPGDGSAPGHLDATIGMRAARQTADEPP